MENKYYFYFQEDSNLSDSVQEFLKYKSENSNIKFVCILSKDEILNYDIFGNTNSIIEELKNLGLSKQDIQINVENPTHKYTPQEWQRIKENADLLRQQGFELGFEDQEKTWTIREVEIANSKIQSTAEEIKKANLSPAETLLAVYMKVTSKKYTYEDQAEHFSQSRSVYGVLNSDKIVCAGYAELFQAILDEIGNDNIQVYQNVVYVERDDKKVPHQNLIVHIKDDRYQIDGWYYLDPTWDNNETTLSYFLVPIKDISKISDAIKEAESYTKKERKAASSKMNSKDIVKNTTYKHKDPESYVSFSSESLFFSKPMIEDLIKENPNFLQDLNTILINNQKSEIEEEISKHTKSLEILKKAKEFIKGKGLIGIPEQIYNLINGSISFEKFKKSCEGDPITKRIQEDDYTDTIYITRDFLEKTLEVEIKVIQKVLADSEAINNPTEEDLNTINIAKERLNNLNQWNRIIDYVMPKAMDKIKEYAVYLNSMSPFDIDEVINSIISQMRETNPNDINQEDFINDFFLKELDKQFMPFEQIINESIADIEADIDYQKTKYKGLKTVESIKLEDVLSLLESKEDSLWFSFNKDDKKGNILKAFNEYIENHSEALPEFKMEQLIAFTLKKMHPELSIEEAISKTEKIIEETKKKSSWAYKKDASNCFAQ